ncbi:hypothetical protein [Ruminococcus sp.]|uniref:hypothetical protein n=1 Tax=Ruminococcus sp. TaxID=41978 RepID=UPI0025E2E98B|nr:hypothetical protein [Ruminococcus sp.]MBQ8965802.1 hypothetical protein [Ruminococcus sp.]
MINEKNKLTGAGLICLLLVVRAFSALTFFPTNMHSGLLFIAGILLAAPIHFMMILPAAKLTKYNKADTSTVYAEAWPFISKSVKSAYLLYFLYEAFLTVGSLSYFMDYFFSVDMPRVLTVLCFALAAVYGAGQQTSALGRTAQFGLAGLLLMLLAVGAGAAEDMQITRFDVAVSDQKSVLINAMLSDTDRCGCLVMFSFLAGRTKGDNVAAARRFIVAKAALIGGIFAMVTAVLGSYAARCKLPFFTLAAASENLITERSDAVFLVVWVFSGVVKLSALTHCGALCAEQLIPRIKRTSAALVVGLLPAAAALPVLLGYGWDRLISAEYGLVPNVLLSFAVPVSFLAAGRSKHKFSDNSAVLQK